MLSKKALKRHYKFLLQFSRKSKVKSSTVIDSYYVKNYEINYFYINCPLWFSNSCRWSTQSSQGMEGKNQKSSFHVQMHVSFIAYFHTKKIRISNSDFSLNFLTIEVALMKSKRHCCWNHQSKISDNLDLGFCEKNVMSSLINKLQNIVSICLKIKIWYPFYHLKPGAHLMFSIKTNYKSS